MPNKEEVEKLKKCINNHHEVMDKEHFKDLRSLFTRRCLASTGTSKRKRLEEVGSKALRLLDVCYRP